MLGEKSEYKDFIKKILINQKYFISKKNSPTIVKKDFRYLFKFKGIRSLSV